MANNPLAPFGQDTQFNVVFATGVADTTTADTNKLLIATAGPNGTLVSSLKALPRDVVGATALYLFRSTDGSTMELIDSETLLAEAPSTTVAPVGKSFDAIDVTNPLRLRKTQELWVGIGVASTEGIGFTIQYTDL